MYARAMTERERRWIGQCLCGSVSYEVDRLVEDVLQCHCENCRRLSGNFVAAVRSETADLDIYDSANRFEWYDLEYARYGFCQGCGSTLFYQAADRRSITSIMVGSLNDATGLRLHEVWFADEAQPHNILPDVAHVEGNGMR